MPDGVGALAEHRVRHRGREVRYLAGGTGPALVLCHGFLGSAENFESWFDALAQVRTLVVPDLPGCGSSPPLDGERHTPDRLADAVTAVVRDRGIDHYDLGGLCLGASVAMALARQRPAEVERLVLHTPLLAPSLVRRRFHAQVRAFMAPGVFPAISWLSRRRAVSDLYKRLLVEGTDVDRHAAEMNFRNQLRADPPALRQWILHGLQRDDTGLLAALQLPTLVLVAAEDRIVDIARLRAVLASMDHVSLVAAADAGHGWTDAYVRRQLEVITAFLLDRPLPRAGDVARVA